MRHDILPVLVVASLGHALVAFVNGEYIGNHKLTLYFQLCSQCNSTKNMLHIYSLMTAIFLHIFAGYGHGSNVEKSFVFRKPANFKEGINHITILGMTLGLPVKILANSV